MERMRNKDLENAWAVQGIRQEKCAKLEEENKKLRKEIKDLVERNIELDKKYMLVLTENRKLNEEYRKKIDNLNRKHESLMVHLLYGSNQTFIT